MEMMDICLLKHVGVLGFLSVVVHLSKQHNVRDPEFGENKRSGCTCMYVHVHIHHTNGGSKGIFTDSSFHDNGGNGVLADEEGTLWWYSVENKRRLITTEESASPHTSMPSVTFTFHQDP